MIRRTLLKAAGMAWVPGSNPPQRPDQILLQLTRSGSGPAPQSPFIVARRIIIIGPTGSLLVYNPSAGLGNLVASIEATAGTDSYGNAVLAGVVTYHQVTPTQFLAVSMNSGQLNFWSATSAAGPWTNVVSEISDASGNFSATAANTIQLVSTAAGILLQATAAAQSITLASPQTLIQPTFGAGPATSALLEVQGDVQAGDGLSIGKGAAVQTLVNGSTINTAGITMQPVTAAAAVTGIILQAGTFDGQVITIPSNAGVGNTATFAASGTSHVALGVAAVINPGACAILTWVSSTSLWYFAQ